MGNKPLNRIKVMLAERMMTNKDLAEKLGKDPATISKWVTSVTYEKSGGTDKGIKLRHYIRKVHSYPRYTRITKHGKIEQKELFEEE